MTKTFKDNFISKYRTLERGEEDRYPGLQCEDCGQSRDSHSHCKVCAAWLEARDRLDMEEIIDLVTYFLEFFIDRRTRKKRPERR